MMAAKRKKSDSPEVDLGALCPICGGEEEGVNNAMVFCDGCDDCYHQECALLETVPKGSWYCAECAPGFQTTRPINLLGPPPAPQRVQLGPPTFELAQRPVLDKAQRRADAGLVAGGEQVGYREDVAKIKAAGLAGATRSKACAVEKLFRDHAERARVDAATPDAVEMYVAWRLKSGLAESTIKGELSTLKRARGVCMPEPGELKKLMQGVTRLATIAGEAKDPILMEGMLRVRAWLLRDWTDNGSEDNQRRMRNWTFFLISFLGFFRASEAVNLKWAHVRLGWKQGESVRNYKFDDKPAGQLVHVALTIVESKTDVRAAGQQVRIAAGEGHGLHDCPAELLRHLRRRARGEYVFEEVRAKYGPAGLKTDTLRNAFKDALEGAGFAASEVERMSLHSLRRGGATAAHACRIGMREIKAHGRWESDTAYVYVLVSDQESAMVTSKILDRFKELGEKPAAIPESDSD